MIYQYKVAEFSIKIKTSEYVSRFHRPERFSKSCGQCPNFGKSWTCPPFEENQKAFFHKYPELLLTATKVIPFNTQIPFNESRRLLRPERVRIQNKLLAMEKEWGGVSVSYVGECLYCGDNKCSRIHGFPCRHPEKARTSLEALGFDLVASVRELFGIDILWSDNGYIPEYLLLVSGLFYKSR